MKNYQYYVLDVFTHERYSGNPLAVVLTEGDLPSPVYENIAREFGYSETSFIYYSEKEKALKVRSFSPTGHEVGGAGHNLLGAVCAALLIKMDIFKEQQKERFVIMKDDRINLKVDLTDPDTPFIGMRQAPAIIKAFVEPADVARALSLETNLVLSGDLSPTVVATEATHLMVPLKNVQALQAARVEKRLLLEIAQSYGFEGFYCFTLFEQDAPYIAQARFFNPGIGIDEDPATGSAAGPLAGLLFHSGLINASKTYRILQGAQLNRPSVLMLEVVSSGIWISGSSVVVMEGRVYAA